MSLVAIHVYKPDGSENSQGKGAEEVVVSGRDNPAFSPDGVYY